MRIVSDKALEEALIELAKLDDREAELRAAKEYGESREKIIYAEQYDKQTGTINERDSKTRTTPEYRKHIEDMRIVTLNHTKARNRRETLMATIDIWRTETASLRTRT